MIQDLGTNKLINAFITDIVPDAADTLFCFRGGKVLAKAGSASPFPRVGEIKYTDKPVYLFSIGDRRFFLCPDANIPVPDGCELTEVRQLRRAKGVLKEDIFALFTAHHLYTWYAGSRFCGCCGAPNTPDHTERALRCTNCDNIVYPRINPAVIVGVTNGEKLLITRYARGRGVSVDALVAGFTEIGETLEQTVEREVFEETGLRVRNIRYYKSQPWGLSGSILAGFYCDVDGDDTVTIDENELSSAVWVNREDIVGQPDDMSLTNEMMMRFRSRSEV